MVGCDARPGHPIDRTDDNAAGRGEMAEPGIGHVVNGMRSLTLGRRCRSGVSFHPAVDTRLASAARIGVRPGRHSPAVDEIPVVREQVPAWRPGYDSGC